MDRELLSLRGTVQRLRRALEKQNTQQSTAITTNTADIVELQGLAADIPSYTIHGALIMVPDAEVAGLAEGWFTANGSNGTVDASLLDKPSGMTWVQQVGPYPG